MTLKLNLDAIAKIEEEMAQPKVSYGNILVVDDEAVLSRQQMLEDELAQS